MARYLLAIDQGTTGSTVMVFDDEGRVRSRAYSEITQHYPKPAWVEHDAEEIGQGIPADRKGADRESDRIDLGEQHIRLRVGRYFSDFAPLWSSRARAPK